MTQRADHDPEAPAAVASPSPAPGPAAAGEPQAPPSGAQLDPPEAERRSRPRRSARPPRRVRRWFDAAARAELPAYDGTLGTARTAADAYARRAKAANTRRAYRAGVAAWCAWCDRHALPCLPARAGDVVAFLAAERGSGLSVNTVELRRAAIRYLHFVAGCPVPTAEAPVAETMAGIRRDAADQGALPAKKLAATADLLHQILAPIPDDLRGRRDRALLLVGFAGALRRAELAAIRVEHLEPRERGLRLTLPRSKGERDGKAVTVALPYGTTALCPVRALRGWLEAAGIAEGPVFRRIWTHPPAARGGKAPCPAPSSAASRSIPAASPASSRRAPQRPASTAPPSAATASNAAPSPPGWSAASTRPGSSNSAGTRATPCSTSISSSATCSRATR